MSPLKSRGLGDRRPFFTSSFDLVFSLGALDFPGPPPGPCESQQLGGTTCSHVVQLEARRYLLPSNAYPFDPNQKLSNRNKLVSPNDKTMSHTSK